MQTPTTMKLLSLLSLCVLSSVAVFGCSTAHDASPTAVGSNDLTGSGSVIACTGSRVDATLTLREAESARGTLAITRHAEANDREHDPPAVSVTMAKVDGDQVPGYVYFEGSKGEQDFYVDLIQDDFDRGSGPVTLYLRWAENGEEFDVGATCAFDGR